MTTTLSHPRSALRPSEPAKAVAVDLTAANWSPAAQRWDRRERQAVVVVSFAGYLVLGFALASRGLLPGDAVARTASASAALLSRDPHLEAIGFVWPPLPTLFEVPLIWLGRWSPILVRDAAAGVVVSALCMAGAVAVVRRWLQACGVARGARLALTLLFAIHPFILTSGANGMSEAGFVCFLLLAADHLARWIETDQPLRLVVCGTALALAYLHRYEAAAAAMGVVGVVAWMSWRRHAIRDDRSRCSAAMARAVAVGAPFGVAFGAWALASWAIVGEPFAQFSSEYGNSAQVRHNAAAVIGAAGALSGGPRAVYLGQQLLVFGALALVVVALLAWFGTRGRGRVAAALAVLVPPLVFHLLASVAGTTYTWGRFVIVAVPLGFLLCGPLAASLGSRGGSRVAARIGVSLVVALAVGSVVGALAVTRRGALSTADEARALGWLPWPTGGPGDVPPAMGLAGREIAVDIDRRFDPARGQVLTDTAVSFPVVLAAGDQRDYVVPSDRDFLAAVAAPESFGVRYLLVGDPDGGLFDSVSDAHPGLYDNGAGIADLVAEWDNDGSTLHYRLYELRERR